MKIIVIALALFAGQVQARESRVFVRIKLESAKQDFKILGHVTHGRTVYGQATQMIKAKVDVIGERHFAVINQTQDVVLSRVPGLLDNGSSTVQLAASGTPGSLNSLIQSDHVSLEKQIDFKLPFGEPVDVGPEVRRQKFVGDFNLISNDPTAPSKYVLSEESKSKEVLAISQFANSILESKTEQVCNDHNVKALNIECLRVEMRRVYLTDAESTVDVSNSVLTYDVRPLTMDAMVIVRSPF